MVNLILSAASVFRTIGSILLAILILLIMITIHEFGHWVAGTILHFGINEFSIGFGPAIVKRKSKKSGQLFALRLIPLGGYCAFKGEDGLDDEKKDKEQDEEKENGEAEKSEEVKEAEEAEKAALQSEEKEETLAQAASSDTVILTPAPEETKEEGKGKAQEIEQAGQALSEETPSEQAERDEFFEAPPASAEKGKGKRIPTWKEKPDDGSFTRKAPWKRIIVLVAGALMNYILALFLIIICFFAYGQTLTAVYEAEPTDEIPAEYCLKDRDIFLKANGKNLYLTTDLSRAVNGKKAGDKVQLTISRYFIDEQTEDGKVVKAHRERMNIEIILRSDVSVKNSSELDSAWKGLGIKYVEFTNAEGKVTGGDYMLAGANCKFGFFETLGRSFVYSFKIAGSILRVLGELLTGRLGLSAMGGPISTIKTTSEMASRGFQYFLEISALIGVNLAVFNLLPVPALDGSKIVFTLIEWMRGKPISRKVEAIIHAVGFVFLLGFAILVDVLQFV